jgi:AraC-like DNA-binding protein
MSCASLRDAIELGIRFLALQAPVFKLDFTVEQSMAIVTLKEQVPLQKREFAVVNFLIEVAEIFRSLLIMNTRPDRYEVLHLYFDFPEPDYFTPYKDRLPQLHFNQAANQFRFPASLLNQPIHSSNPAVVQLAITQGESELARLGLMENWLDRVKALIVCSQGKYPDLPMLASQLYLSERTLKRKLAELGLTFSEMLDEVRKRDACKLLEETNLTVDEVALRLGFQDRSNFTRAFRRWMGTPPSQYRLGHNNDQKST